MIIPNYVFIFSSAPYFRCLQLKPTKFPRSPGGFELTQVFTCSWLLGAGIRGMWEHTLLYEMSLWVRVISISCVLMEIRRMHRCPVRVGGIVRPNSVWCDSQLCHENTWEILEQARFVASQSFGPVHFCPVTREGVKCKRHSVEQVPSPQPGQTRERGAWVWSSVGGVLASCVQSPWLCLQ